MKSNNIKVSKSWLSHLKISYNYLHHFWMNYSFNWRVKKYKEKKIFRHFSYWNITYIKHYFRKFLFLHLLVKKWINKCNWQKKIKTTTKMSIFYRKSQWHGQTFNINLRSHLVFRLKYHIYFHSLTFSEDYCNNPEELQFVSRSLKANINFKTQSKIHPRRFYTSWIYTQWVK